MESDIEVAAVVTNPDRPAGRGMKLKPSPVKEVALRSGLDVIQVAKARDPQLHERLAALAPDVAVVVAYGSILPAALLEVPRKGFVNLHFSLLPLYRGAAPVQRSIMNGDDTTGVSVMVLTEGMDEGPVIARLEEPIAPADTTATVGSRLAVKGAEVLIVALGGYLDGSLVPQPQDDAAATYAPKITTEDARIDWSVDARSIRDLVRALDPHPGAWTTLDGQRIKVLEVHEADAPELSSGEIAAADGLLVGTGSGALALDLIQPATKRAMSGADFVRGARPTPNARMGS